MPNLTECRLYVILARDGRSALIFRRGPRNNMRLVRWWLKEDCFEDGQWIKHKCYVRRCDLSPDDEFLLYFAARFVRPIYSWTAISRPPYFTTLALWPKTDAWGGGGLMLDRYMIGLNHKKQDRQQSDEHALHSKYKVVPLDEYAGHGEDAHVEHSRLIRDGWKLEQPGEAHFHSGGTARQLVTFDPPEVMAKRDQKNRQIILRKILTGVAAKQGKHYIERYVLHDQTDRKLREFDTFDWADWDANSDLLLADGGKIWRLSQELTSVATDEPFAGCRLLIDLSDRKFEAITPPFWATTWQPRK
jgi:hypothetical protein